MKLEYCQYLLEINRLHSISAAAQSLHIGQTTLSAIVKRIEEDVGFSIFQRTPTGVTATEAGNHLMELFWEINVKYEELLRVKHLDTPRIPAISGLSAPSILMHLALPLTARFSEFDVQGNLTFEDMPSEAICEHIVENTANIGLTYLTNPEIWEIQNGFQKDILQIHQLLEDQLCALVSPEHPLAERQEIDISELAGRRLVSVGPARQDKIVGDLAYQGCLATRFSSFDDMYQAVLRHAAVGFAPRFTEGRNQTHIFPGCRLIPFCNTEHENKMYVCLITPKKRKLRYQENIIVSCIAEYFQTLQKPASDSRATGEII